MIQVTRESLERKASECIEIVLAKNSDYGDAWQKKGVAGVLVRLSDKATRLENLSGKQALVVDESWLDTVRDMAGYCLLAMLCAENE